MHTKNDCIFYQFNLEIDTFIIPEVIFKKLKKSHKGPFRSEKFSSAKRALCDFFRFFKITSKIINLLIYKLNW